MLRLMARNIGDKVFDSERILFQGVDITLKICKTESAQQIFPLVMKPTDQVDFQLETNLVVCLRD